eukprot:13634737-Ditylum_brightwellii.AAC.1
MDPIESGYYTPAEGSAGGCVLTKDICASCYEDQGIMSVDDLIVKCNLGGKLPLKICRHCFDNDVTPSCSSKCITNIFQGTRQRKASKKRQMDQAVVSGQRSGRRH